MTEVIEFIKAVGVPAAIAFFVLWRLDSTLQDLVKELRAFHAEIKTVVGAQVVGQGALLEQLGRQTAEIGHDVKSLLSEHRRPADDPA